MKLLREGICALRTRPELVSAIPVLWFVAAALPTLDDIRRQNFHTLLGNHKYSLPLRLHRL